MTEIAFQYDSKNQKWIQCANELLATADIEKLPIVLLAKFADIKDNDLYVYCQRHRKLEPIAKEGEVYLVGSPALGDDLKFQEIKFNRDLRDGEFVSMSGCLQTGFYGYAEFYRHTYQRDPFVYVPFRWRVFQKSAGQPLSIAADVAKIRLLIGDSLSIKWLNVAYSINTASQKLVVTQSKVFDGWDKKNNDIPTEVTDFAMNLMREDTRLDSGLKPSVLSQMDGHNKIESFVERPFDLNIVYLKTFFHEFNNGDFDSLFPREQKDNYQKICELLDIHPPKSLRKAYTFNPYSIIWYIYLIQLGFSDINLIQEFFDLKERFLHVPLKEFIFSVSHKSVYRSRETMRYGDSRLESAEFYIKWLLWQGKTKRAVKWIKESSVGSIESWQWDTLSAFKNYKERLSPEIRQRLLKDGLTQYVHDIISWEVTVLSSRWANVGVNYPQKILDYECRINGYEFHVIRETLHLTHLGHQVKNCVATYRQAVLDGKSIIVSVQKDGSYVACIELRDENRIVQALGVCNQRLTGEVLLVCRYWAKRNALVVQSLNHLSLPKDRLGYPLFQDLTEVIVEECREEPPKIPEKTPTFEVDLR